MPVTGPQISAAVFTSVEVAEQGWQLLNDADIPSAMIAEPGTLGAPFRVSLFVERENLDAAQAVLAPLVATQG